MKLRDYRPEDFRTICEIDRLCFPPGIAYSSADIACSLAEPGTFAVMGEEGARVAGFVLARRESRNRGHIITIDVLPEFRQKRLGTALMAEAHHRLEESGVKRVLLETSVENAPAIAFYKKMGYAMLRRLPRYYQNEIDAYLMGKDL